MDLTEISNWKGKNEHGNYRPINLHKTLNYHVNLPQQTRYDNNVRYYNPKIELLQLRSRNYIITLLFVLLLVFLIFLFPIAFIHSLRS